jgi:hypothetical protein
MIGSGLKQGALTAGCLVVCLAVPGWSSEKDELQKQIDELQKRLEKLEERAVLQEPSEEIRRVKQYVCRSGHIHEQRGDDICPDCGASLQERTAFQKFKFARRQAIADRIGAAMEEEFGRRVQIGFSMTGSTQYVYHETGRSWVDPDTGAVMGKDTKERGYGVASADLLFLGRPATYVTMFMDVEAIGGAGPDEEFGTRAGLNADAGSLQSSDGVDRLQVREAWLQADHPDKLFALAAGKIDLTNYFDANAVANDETTQFLTSALVNNPALEQPVNGPGAVLTWNTFRDAYVSVASQSADDSGSRITDDAFSIGEVGYRSTLLWGRPGHIRLWGRYAGGVKHSPKGSGVSLDQMVTSRLTWFGRAGVAEKDHREDIDAWSTGFEWKGPLPARPRDRLGVGFTLQKADLADRNARARDELLESYYSFHISEQMSASLHNQWLFETAGTEGTTFPQGSVGVVGLRVQMDY